MKKLTFFIAVWTIYAGFITYLAFPFVQNGVDEIQVYHRLQSPDHKWSAIEQLEVKNVALAMDDPVYAIRLKGSKQKDPKGDLILAAEVENGIEMPEMRWSGDRLVLTLSGGSKFRTFETPVNGVGIELRRKTN